MSRPGGQLRRPPRSPRRAHQSYAATDSAAVERSYPSKQHALPQNHFSREESPIIIFRPKSIIFRGKNHDFLLKNLHLYIKTDLPLDRSAVGCTRRCWPGRPKIVIFQQKKKNLDFSKNGCKTHRAPFLQLFERFDRCGEGDEVRALPRVVPSESRHFKYRIHHFKYRIRRF